MGDSIRDPLGDDLPAGLGAPARRALAQAGYSRLEQFSAVRESDLRELHGMGPKAIGLLRSAMAARGQSFAGEAQGRVSAN
jgi:hypothetical protein